MRYLTRETDPRHRPRDKTVAEADLGGPPPARRAHNPVAEIGLTSLAADTSLPADLAGAIALLSIPARYELYILMRIGAGHLAAKNWERGLSEAEALGNELTPAIVDDPDHLEKGLYEISRPSRKGSGASASSNRRSG